ncbi:DDX25 helicase, partial [Chloroceryle aenea]|nr:DDX25 helicase [Chloroceryle aenea]
VDLAETSLLNKLIRTSLVESSHHVEILQQDPSSPLFSIKSFEELPLKKELLQGVYSMGFNRPSKIQETALPIMLAYPPQNLIAQSQSGTGKTAAFALAMLSRVNAAEKYPQCLCLAPTYELALQIGLVVEKIGQFCTDIRVTYAIRGNRVWQGAVPQEQIVIGTPGKTMDWCFKHRVVDLRKITLFVLDEADIMIDTQCLSYQSIRIQRALPKDCQMLLFSATFRERVRAFATRIVCSPIVIKLREEELTLSNIRQYYLVCRNREEKYRALCNIYGSVTVGQAMVFCQVKHLSLPGEMGAGAVGGVYLGFSRALNIPSQPPREAQGMPMRQQWAPPRPPPLFVGIDVQQVTVVVNFSLPTDHRREPVFETYLHRIGRTGRFGKKGVAFSMVESQDVRLIRMIEEHFLTKIKQLDPNNLEQLEDL